MSTLEDRLAWLDQVKEEVLEPERPIIDPHHHLWPGELHYLLDDFLLINGACKAWLWWCTKNGTM